MKTSAKRVLSVLAASSLLIAGAASVAAAETTSSASVDVKTHPAAGYAKTAKASAVFTFGSGVLTYRWGVSAGTAADVEWMGWGSFASSEPGQPRDVPVDSVYLGDAKYMFVAQSCSANSFTAANFKTATTKCAAAASTATGQTTKFVWDANAPVVGYNTAAQITVAPSVINSSTGGNAAISAILYDKMQSSGFKSYSISIWKDGTSPAGGSQAKVGDPVLTIDGASDLSKAAVSADGNWLILNTSDSANLSSLSDATYWACVTVVDNVGQTNAHQTPAQKCTSFQVSKTAPVIIRTSPTGDDTTIHSGKVDLRYTVKSKADLKNVTIKITKPDGSVYGDDPFVRPYTEFVGTCTDAAGCEIANGFYIPNSTKSEDNGPWKVVVYVKDINGNEATYEHTVIIDNAKPAFAITNPAVYKQVVGPNQVPFQFKTTGQAGGTISYIITCTESCTGGPAGYQEKGTVKYVGGTNQLTDYLWDVPSDAPSGIYTIVASAKGDNGKTSDSVTRTFVIDKTATSSPDVEIVVGTGATPETAKVGSTVPIFVTVKDGTKPVVYAIHVYDKTGKTIKFPDTYGPMAGFEKVQKDSFTAAKTGIYNVMLEALIDGKTYAKAVAIVVS